MNMQDRERAWREWEATPFQGWDFSRLEGHIDETPLPWDYAQLAREAMSQATSVLDVGTGGGELLGSLRAVYPRRVIASEGYAPNAKLAQERLAPLGVQVIHAHDDMQDTLPLTDASVDLILNRHSSFNLSDYARILRPGGRFLTQQVDGSDLQDLAAAFGGRPLWLYQDLAFARTWAERAGFVVDLACDWRGQIVFHSVGALVYFLRAIPWIVPGFSVDSHRDVLIRMQQQLDAGESLAYAQRRYLLRAQRSAI